MSATKVFTSCLLVKSVSDFVLWYSCMIFSPPGFLWRTSLTIYAYNTIPHMDMLLVIVISTMNTSRQHLLKQLTFLTISLWDWSSVLHFFLGVSNGLSSKGTVEASERNDVSEEMDTSSESFKTKRFVKVTLISRTCSNGYYSYHKVEQIWKCAHSDNYLPSLTWTLNKSSPFSSRSEKISGSTSVPDESV